MLRHFVIALLAAVGAFAAEKDVSPKTIERMKKSVVGVVCVNTEGGVRITGVVGSGFFVDRNGRFVTAAHVLDGFQLIQQQRGPCNPAIYVPVEGWAKFAHGIRFKGFNFTKCDRDNALDIAVCTPAENPFSGTHLAKGVVEPVTFDTEECADGTAMAFTGFPLEFLFPITSKGYIAAKMSTQNVSGLWFDYLMDKAAWPGASGSLVYLENGSVIGMLVQAGVNRGSGLSYARSAAAIVDFLSKHPAEVQK